jgi:hypothetical protein
LSTTPPWNRATATTTVSTTSAMAMIPDVRALKREKTAPEQHEEGGL